MTTDETLRLLGFAKAAAFRSGAFRLELGWRSRQVVYIWTRGCEAEVLRVGIACGQKAFENRYASYNRWLAGRFKHNDATEQEKARLFRSRLDDTCEVWAREVADKPTALKEEAQLRVSLGPVLELDLMTAGWAKQELAAWRKARSAHQAGSAEPAARATKPKAKENVGSEITPSLVSVFGRLKDLLIADGFTMSPETEGWKFSQDGRGPIKIHPKPRKGCLRVNVGEKNELAAPDALRDAGYRQRGWLVVWPKDAELALDYVRRCLTAGHSDDQA